MNGEMHPDVRIGVTLDAAEEPMFVMHPCRCDAPDPEASRMEPIEVPLTPLREDGRVLLVCPECDCHVLVVASGSDEGR
jgi:hypothetical protein